MQHDIVVLCVGATWAKSERISQARLSVPTCSFSFHCLAQAGHGRQDHNVLRVLRWSMCNSPACHMYGLAYIHKIEIETSLDLIAI